MKPEGFGVDKDCIIAGFSSKEVFNPFLCQLCGKTVICLINSLPPKTYIKSFLFP